MTDPQQLPEQEDDLLEAVRGLTAEVRTLRDRLETLYAPRAEVKREGQRRAWRFLGFAVAIVIVAQGLSMTTISYCFLSASNQTSHYCRLMPGYGRALDQSTERLDRFNRILDGLEGTATQAEANQRKLEDIDRRLKALEEQG
jgi:uncharacterized protein involved in exopolysaccharide biosynthesis